MTRIRVDTEYVREIGRRIAADGDRLAEIGHQLQHAIGSLDTGSWDGVSRARAEPMLDRVRPESERASEQLRDLACKLSRIAEAFERADAQSAAGVDTIPWSMARPLLGWRTNPVLRMGALLTGGGGASAVALTILAQSSSKRASLLQGLKQVPNSVAAWLAPAVASVAGLFGWQPQGPSVVTPKGSPSFVPVPPPQPPEVGTITTKIIAGRVPNRDLTPALKQTSKSYECGPTAASMVLGYWNRIDPDNETRTPQQIIQGLGPRFNSNSGISADELVEGLKEMNLGYDTIERRAGLNKEELRTAVEDGPVLAQVHLNWGSSGYAHMVTVTGVSEDGQMVYVNDPLTGQSVKKSWGDFERSWTFRGKYSGSSHLIVEISP